MAGNSDAISVAARMTMSLFITSALMTLGGRV